MIKIIGPTEPAKCTECGKIAELRPYGEGNALICFPCGTKDAETTKRTEAAFRRMLEDELNDFPDEESLACLNGTCPLCNAKDNYAQTRERNEPM